MTFDVPEALLSDLRQQFSGLESSWSCQKKNSKFKVRLRGNLAGAGLLMQSKVNAQLSHRRVGRLRRSSCTQGDRSSSFYWGLQTRGWSVLENCVSMSLTSGNWVTYH
jgi:hypothetical protein